MDEAFHNDVNIEVILTHKLQKVSPTEEDDYETLKDFRFKDGRFVKYRYNHFNLPTGYDICMQSGHDSIFNYSVFVSHLNENESLNKIEREITPTFFKEWIEKNDFLPGKFESIFLSDFSSIFLFPGSRVSEPICWLMDYLWLKKLQSSNISEFALNLTGFSCMSSIYTEKKHVHILEGRLEGNNIWVPVTSYNCTQKYLEFRFIQVAQQRIDHDWSLLTEY